MPPPPFLPALFSHSTPPTDRPRVTLTFAQSLDAKIAGPNRTQLILSGNESMRMTHWMRTMHDAILVGIGTALNDDPQLNTRHLPAPAPTEPRRHLPRPVILDSHLRLPPTCKLLANHKAGIGRRPWIVAIDSKDADWRTRYDALERAGARIVAVTTDPGSGIPVPAILNALHAAGINSIMVEGGARVIESFLAASQVDHLVITVAPTFVGDHGVAYSLKHMPHLKHVHTELMGNDTVIALAAE